MPVELGAAKIEGTRLNLPMVRQASCQTKEKDE
jgi:hypothetical protein